MSWDRITPLLPRAPSSAARATESTICSRPISSIVCSPSSLREAVDLVQAGAQRERHVVARIAVGDGEHVEVVDLRAARLEVRERALDHGAEADEAGLRRGGHGGRRGGRAGPRRPW
jgi:hypothetical protein